MPGYTSCQSSPCRKHFFDTSFVVGSCWYIFFVYTIFVPRYKSCQRRRRKSVDNFELLDKRFLVTCLSIMTWNISCIKRRKQSLDLNRVSNNYDARLIKCPYITCIFLKLASIKKISYVTTYLRRLLFKSLSELREKWLVMGLIECQIHFRKFCRFFDAQFVFYVIFSYMCFDRKLCSFSYSVFNQLHWTI